MYNRGDCMKVLVVGGVSIDTKIYTPEIQNVSSDMSLFASHMNKHLGGTGAGKAFMMAKFAAETTLVCQANEEDFMYIEKQLKEVNIQSHIMNTDKTEKHTNIMHGENHRLSIFTSFPTDSKNINDVVTDQMLKEADLIFLNINSFCKPLIPRLHPFKEKIVVDLHDYQLGSSYHEEFLDIGAYLFTSCIYLKDQMTFLEDTLRRYNLKVSVITCNKEGAMGIDLNGHLRVSNALEDIKVVDSNGAGDAFVVGFMMKYFMEQNLSDALLFGNVCGAYSCESESLIDQHILIEDIEKRYRSLKK